MDSASYRQRAAENAVAWRDGHESDVAMSQLPAACAAMTAIERQSSLAPLQLLHATAAALHGFAAAIDECEAAGLQRPQILRSPEAVRQMHGRSPFVHRLQSWPRG